MASSMSCRARTKSSECGARSRLLLMDSEELAQARDTGAFARIERQQAEQQELRVEVGEQQRLLALGFGRHGHRSRGRRWMRRPPRAENRGWVLGKEDAFARPASHGPNDRWSVTLRPERSCPEASLSPTALALRPRCPSCRDRAGRDCGMSAAAPVPVCCCSRLAACTRTRACGPAAPLTPGRSSLSPGSVASRWISATVANRETVPLGWVGARIWTTSWRCWTTFDAT
eukprot:scaffold16571_cov122-Isochrysis_galbana.AAC.3